jgi:hypothetical protein
MSRSFSSPPPPCASMACSGTAFFLLYSVHAGISCSCVLLSNLLHLQTVKGQEASAEHKRPTILINNYLFQHNKIGGLVIFLLHFRTERKIRIERYMNVCTRAL